MAMVLNEHSLSSLDRARGALLGLAVGDALGAPVEFKPRDSFERVTEMMAGGYFRLPAGAWTDDTAMALCLADSLLSCPEFDAKDLLDRFLRWMDLHENTSTGKCIGVGQNTMIVLGRYRRSGIVEAQLVKGRSDGNGALMRLAPVACRHFRSPQRVRELAQAQSRSTHCSDLSAAACEAAAALMANLIAGEDWHVTLRALSEEVWPAEVLGILRGDWKSKDRSEISSSGFVIHTLEAAVWAVGSTLCFEDAVIEAVNLGHDADTVGAVAGQLAGARYGLSAIPDRWLDVLIKREHSDFRAMDLHELRAASATSMGTYAAFRYFQK